MTTIAWDGKTLAADSQITGTFIEQGGTTKIVKRKGQLIAHTGTLGVFESYLDGSLKHLPEENELLIIDESGQAYWHGTHGKSKLPSPTAIGSGANFAIAAMMAGASAKKAVQIAAKLDPCTGGAVRTASVKKK